RDERGEPRRLVLTRPRPRARETRCERSAIEARRDLFEAIVRLVCEHESGGGESYVEERSARERPRLARGDATARSEDGEVEIGRRGERAEDGGQAVRGRRPRIMREHERQRRLRRHRVAECEAERRERARKARSAERIGEPREIDREAM